MVYRFECVRMSLWLRAKSCEESGGFGGLPDIGCPGTGLCGSPFSFRAIEARSTERGAFR